jgi:hypothetical protein
MRWLRMTAVGLLLGLTCGAMAEGLWGREAQAPASEPLYFSLAVSQGGKPLARPQLVGETGKDLKLLLSQRDGSPRLALRLKPALARPYDGSHFGVEVSLELPGRAVLERSFTVQHGEELHAQMGEGVELTLLAMRVRSPEFEAYLQSAPPRVDGSLAAPQSPEQD